MMNANERASVPPYGKEVRASSERGLPFTNRGFHAAFSLFPEENTCIPSENQSKHAQEPDAVSNLRP